MDYNTLTRGMIGMTDEDVETDSSPPPQKKWNVTRIKGRSAGYGPAGCPFVYIHFYVQPISKSDSRAISCNRPFRSPPWVSSPS